MLLQAAMLCTWHVVSLESEYPRWILGKPDHKNALPQKKMCLQGVYVHAQPTLRLPLRKSYASGLTDIRANIACAQITILYGWGLMLVCMRERAA
jgi:hypothetical protein